MLCIKCHLHFGNYKKGISTDHLTTAEPPNQMPRGAAKNSLRTGLNDGIFRAPSDVYFAINMFYQKIHHGPSPIVVPFIVNGTPTSAYNILDDKARKAVLGCDVITHARSVLTAGVGSTI